MSEKVNLKHIDVGKTTVNPDVLEYTPAQPATLVPCGCGCGADVPIDGLGSALSGSMGGMKIFFATKACQQRYKAEHENCII